MEFGKTVVMTMDAGLRSISVAVLGRSSGAKSGLVEELLHALAEQGAQVERFESRHARLTRHLDEKFRRSVGRLLGHAGIDWFLRRGVVRKLTKGVIAFFDPYLWPLLVLRLCRKTIPATELRRWVRTRRGRGQKVLFVSHSAGAILGAMAEGEVGVIGHVAFGYPFKHPRRDDEAYRTRCLRGVDKPFVILQGDGDEYGTVKDAGRYALSPRVMLHAVVGTHDYNEFGEVDHARMLRLTEEILLLAGYRVWSAPSEVVHQPG